MFASRTTGLMLHGGNKQSRSMPGILPPLNLPVFSLPYEPSPHVPIGPVNDNSTADCKGKRIGILIVTYNAITTLPKVLKRIPPSVWQT